MSNLSSQTLRQCALVSSATQSLCMHATFMPQHSACSPVARAASLVASFHHVWLQNATLLLLVTIPISQRLVWRAAKSDNLDADLNLEPSDDSRHRGLKGSPLAPQVSHQTSLHSILTYYWCKQYLQASACNNCTIGAGLPSDCWANAIDTQPVAVSCAWHMVCQDKLAKASQS